MKSWKTTIAAILAAVIAILSVVVAIVDGDPSTVPNWAAAGTAIAAAVGLLFARDNDKTSEDVGAK